MSREKPNAHYTGEFKQMEVEDVRKNGLGYNEAMRKYEITARSAIQRWERIYLEEGAMGLYVERRRRAAKLEKKKEEDLIAENQRLRMEIEYLKKLNALVQERQLQERSRRQSGN